MVLSGQPECALLSPDLPSPPEVDVSLLSPFKEVCHFGSHDLPGFLLGPLVW